MRRNNPRHLISSSLFEKLPTTLLVFWATIHFSNTHLNTNLNLPQLTIDFLVLLVKQIAQVHHIFFCGFLPCRRCFRDLKDLQLDTESRGLLYYVTCVVFRVRNAGATVCTTTIPNSSILHLLIIPAQEEATQILRMRNIPIIFPTAPPPPTQVPTFSVAEARSASDSRPSNSSRRRARSPDRVERVPNDLGDLGTSLEHRMSQYPPGLLNVSQNISPPPGMRPRPSVVTFPQESKREEEAGASDGYITE